MLYHLPVGMCQSPPWGQEKVVADTNSCVCGDSWHAIDAFRCLLQPQVSFPPGPFLGLFCTRLQELSAGGVSENGLGQALAWWQDGSGRLARPQARPTSPALPHVIPNPSFDLRTRWGGYA